MNLTNWLSPELLKTLGWSLLHFVWQGIAIAALAALAMASFRRSTAKYTAGVLALVVMVAALLTTFVVLQKNSVAAIPVLQKPAQEAPCDQPAAAIGASQTTTPPTSLSSWALPFLVQCWLAGVLFFSLRTAGSLLFIERMRRKNMNPVSRALLAKCRALQDKLRVNRAVQFCECAWLDAPAVIGWFRPVVLLPVRTLMGLSEEQLEAVLAHELAHIKRFDCFVNLFQVAAESLLFFHPAVWWLNKRIRAERENCCDDVAIAVCGNTLGYARALTLMEEWRSVPAMGMALNGSPLAERIARILGLRGAQPASRNAGLAAGMFCLTGALVAGSMLWGFSHPVAAQALVANSLKPLRASFAQQPTPKPKAQPQTPAKAAKPASQSPTPAPTPAAEPNAAPEPTPEPQANTSYLQEMNAAGLKNLDVDQLISLKIQGVTGDYIRKMAAQGLQGNADEIIAMKIHGVTPDYVVQLRKQGISGSTDEVISMKIQGVTPEFIQQMTALGMKMDADSAIGIKIQGVTPEFIEKMRSLGLKLDADEAVGMRVQGVTPEFVQQMQSLGLKPTSDEVIGMRVQGVTPEYVKSMQALGLKFDVDELIGAKVMGVTPEFVEKARSHGFQNLTLDKLIGLKQANIL